MSTLTFQNGKQKEKSGSKHDHLWTTWKAKQFLSTPILSDLVGLLPDEVSLDTEKDGKKAGMLNSFKNWVQPCLRVVPSSCKKEIYKRAKDGLSLMIIVGDKSIII